MGSSLVGEGRGADVPPILLTNLAAPSKKKRNREAKQQALLLAAAKLFALRGYEASTTREIAACAGCAEGLIHRYFTNKAGLLLALIQQRVSREVVDLSERLPLAATLEEEFLQLMEWEVQHLWEDRDFLKVIIPRALLDPAIGKVLARIGTSRHAQVIVKRLMHFKQCRAMPEEDVQALARLIGELGFAFGFMRPVVLGQDRGRAQKMAAQTARFLIRSL